MLRARGGQRAQQGAGARLAGCLQRGGSGALRSPRAPCAGCATRRQAPTAPRPCCCCCVRQLFEYMKRREREGEGYASWKDLADAYTGVEADLQVRGGLGAPGQNGRASLSPRPPRPPPPFAHGAQALRQEGRVLALFSYDLSLQCDIYYPLDPRLDMHGGLPGAAAAGWGVAPWHPREPAGPCASAHSRGPSSPLVAANALATHPPTHMLSTRSGQRHCGAVAADWQRHA